ncbi:MAG: hypothetical protein ACLTAI_06075 [Thomasclavelia sp.]
MSVMEEDNVLTLNIPVKHDYRFVAFNYHHLHYRLNNHVQYYRKVLPRKDAIK